MLQTQVYLYSFDTACFYTETEMIWHRKLLRCYHLRYELARKIHKGAGRKKGIYIFQKKRISRLIDSYKIQLTQKFQETNKNLECRTLRESALIDKNIVSLFESDLTRTMKCQPDELTQDMFIVRVYFFEVAESLIKRGCMYKGQKYVLFSASAGQIRTKKFVMVREDLYRSVQDKLMCGLTIDKINKKGGINVNKFLAYLALSNSSTDIWEDFDIDKSIVVDDFETNVIDTVDFINDITYDVERKEMEVPIPHMDGAGIMLNQNTRMVRLPWVKGLMIQMPFDLFIKEKCNGAAIVKDIYGKEYNILEDGIEYIFTKSQFKMWKYYDSWEEYKKHFKQYGCDACYCNPEENNIPNAEINYQMLQSLTDITEKEMQRLSRKTVKEINQIGKDYQVTMDFLGAYENNKYLTNMQRCLLLYPELLHEEYNKEFLRDLKRSRIKSAKAGRLLVNGKFTFISPDLYAFCEWLFLGIKNPQGLLQKGEVSCNIYENGIELDCLRSPHLYKEHAVRKNVAGERVNRWFTTKCLYTSVHDTISKVLQFDCDGDRSLVVADQFFCKLAKRNMKDIVPLYYDMKKAEPVHLDANSLFDGLLHAYTGGNIGIYSNNISKIWNCQHVGEDELLAVKLLCMENNFQIDYAKTLHRLIRPKSVDEFLVGYTNEKLPHFFKYAKDKADYQVQEWQPSPVNYLEKIIPRTRANIPDSLGIFDYKMLMHDREFEYQEEHSVIVDLYDYYNTHKRFLYFEEEEGGRPKPPDQIWIYKKIRKEILELPFDTLEIVDALIYFLFRERPKSIKKTFWRCFGEEVLENLKWNLDPDSKVCLGCGKRIVGNRKFCSVTCKDKYNNAKKLHGYKY